MTWRWRNFFTHLHLLSLEPPETLEACICFLMIRFCQHWVLLLWWRGGMPFQLHSLLIFETGRVKHFSQGSRRTRHILALLDKGRLIQIWVKLSQGKESFLARNCEISPWLQPCRVHATSLRQKMSYWKRQVELQFKELEKWYREYTPRWDLSTAERYYLLLQDYAKIWQMAL